MMNPKHSQEFQHTRWKWRKKRNEGQRSSGTRIHSRKYLRSLSVNNKQKEEETIILLINGKQDYPVDISTTIQALQVLAGSQDYNGRRRNRNVKGNRRANRDYAELVDNSV
jgi:hypothetical protein